VATEIRTYPQRRRGADLPKNIAGLGAVYKNYFAINRSNEGGSGLKDKDRAWIILGVKS
jgi:hypothetical protein